MQITEELHKHVSRYSENRSKRKTYFLSQLRNCRGSTMLIIVSSRPLSGYSSRLAIAASCLWYSLASCFDWQQLGSRFVVSPCLLSSCFAFALSEPPNQLWIDSQGGASLPLVFLSKASTKKERLFIYIEWNCLITNSATETLDVISNSTLCNFTIEHEQQHNTTEHKINQHHTLHMHWYKTFTVWFLKYITNKTTSSLQRQKLAPNAS